MKERPILFNNDMVNAILAGRKTQTRRCLKRQPFISDDFPIWWAFPYDEDGNAWLWPNAEKKILAMCPYGRVGDQLWVLETWATSEYMDASAPSKTKGLGLPIWFEADDSCESGGSNIRSSGISTKGKLRPSIHMPRWASRIQLEITNVRVEQLQDISEEEAMAEGIRESILQCEDGAFRGWHWEKEIFGDVEQPWHNARSAFMALWDRINFKSGYGWGKNPWVWVVEFKMIKPEPQL